MLMGFQLKRSFVGLGLLWFGMFTVSKLFRILGLGPYTHVLEATFGYIIGMYGI